MAVHSGTQNEPIYTKNVIARKRTMSLPRQPVLKPHPVVGLHHDEALAGIAGGIARAAAGQRLRQPRRRQPHAARRPATPPLMPLS